MEKDEPNVEHAPPKGGQITVIGSASTAQQCINAGLSDELQIGIVPILLGGLRFCDNVSLDHIELEKTKILESPSRIDLRYRRLK